ncbi:alpha/beta fold hydrolase [Polynucleobacter kasalickyi]|uniref:Pimeloyl-ACP methyl ester carboxylesterase n=1 Tax=Polynucleobacter kasalickyi TaxID=1938817 RepID=A0A1W1Z6G9_9BURK|nr:alpha/beta hydrolase [Polynucleobacter kasalickyi]SMC44039.1 Pimeloyl-ACP methyl ester carboxylesterase [Polynucleobacter kasalickyi]
MKKILMSLALLLSVLFYFWTPNLDVHQLEANYAKPPSQFMNVLGSRMHVRDTGPKQAPALILIHGFGASLHTWDEWSSTLDKEYRVIRFDLPGFGLTGPDSTGDYTDDRTNALLLELMRQLQIEQATLIGNSIGGRIAWYFTSQYPAQVNKLVLISPDGFKSPNGNYGQQPEISSLMYLIQFIMPKFLLKQNLEIAYANPATLTPSMLDQYYELLLAPGVRQAMMQRMQQRVLKDPKPFLQSIQQPTLLLWGEQDRMIPVENAQDYLSLLPHAELQTLKNTGHLPQEENPAHHLRGLLEFLKSPKLY